MSAPEAKYLIRKHGGYYRPNRSGYTTSWHEAGRYTEAEAIAESHPNGHDGPRDGMSYVHEDDVRPSVYKDPRDYTAADLEAAVRRALEWAAMSCAKVANECRTNDGMGQLFASSAASLLATDIRTLAADPATVAKIARGE